MSNTIERLAETLKSHGLSLTRPRKRVFETLNGQEPLPLSAMVDACPDIDRASVYRTLDVFERLGIIRKIPIGWNYRYELTDSFSHHHHHAVCLRCGTLLALPDSPALESALQHLATKQDFKVVDHEIELRGYCSNCR